MRRPLLEHSTTRKQHRAPTPRGAMVHHHHHRTGGRLLVAMVSAPESLVPGNVSLFNCSNKNRLIDDLHGVYHGHDAVRIRDWDDWDTWDDETDELDYAQVTELLK